MTIHKTRGSSMTWTYVRFGLLLVWLGAALATIAIGWFSLQIEAWRVGEAVVAALTMAGFWLWARRQLG